MANTGNITGYKPKTKLFFKEQYGLNLTDDELQEIHLSLFFLARALHRYHMIKKGIIKCEKRG